MLRADRFRVEGVGPWTQIQSQLATRANQSAIPKLGTLNADQHPTPRKINGTSVQGVGSRKCDHSHRQGHSEA